MMFICVDKNQKSKVWFEFTNFKFLISGESSNSLVKIYVGNVDKKDNLESVSRHPIGIYDPESAFVFQKAIVSFCNNLPAEYENNSLLMLFKALEVGYSAIIHHFGFSDSLSNRQESVDAEQSILDFNGLLYQRYATAAKSIDRLVTKETIERRKGMGFDAYYPNPIYLKDMAWYVRPEGMDYAVYTKLCSILPPSFIDSYSKDSLPKLPRSDYDICDEYTQILDRLYPGEVISFSKPNADAVYYAPLNRISTGGDTRSLEKLANKDVGGFWPRLCSRYKQPVGVVKNYNEAEFCQPQDLITITANNKKEMFADDSFFQFLFMDGVGVVPYHTAHISASTDFNSAMPAAPAKQFYAYAFFAEGAFNSPSVYFGQVRDLNGHREITHFGGVEWDNIVGVRAKIKYSKHFYFGIGPVFLKDGLIAKDQESFWKILQIMGGKPQNYSCRDQSAMINSCTSLFENGDEKTISKLVEKVFFMPLGYGSQ